jgi:hypothetical protein
MIRISCATLNRIRYQDGRLLVVLNRNRLKNGRRILTPIGGSSSFRDSRVLHSLCVRLERDDSKDLRFYIDEIKLSVFETWFRTQKGRETDPFRELYEELVLEEHLIKDLVRQDIGVRYAGLATTQRQSDRDIAKGVLTNYFFEVFEILLIEPLWKEVLRSLNKPGCRASLVSIAEIQAGKTSDGIEIGSNCLALIQVQ